MKFKYFFNSLSGTPGEQGVNKWLNENNNIELVKISMNSGGLAIFYKEIDSSNNFKFKTVEELSSLLLEELYDYQNKFFNWYADYYTKINNKIMEKIDEQARI